MRNAFFAVAAPILFSLFAGSALAQQLTKLDAQVQMTPTYGPCVVFSNLGTNNPKLLNNCNDSRTVKVVNYDRNGGLVAERVFHLWHNENRPVQFPGYQMAIEWEKGWTDDGADDGANYVTLTHREYGGVDLWEARNSSADRFNAVEFKIYTNARLSGSTWYVLPPGQTARMYAFIPPDTGYLILNWAKLDPK